MTKSFDVKCVQSVLLKMGGGIAKILEENKIPYMLVFGTLLGAVRHKGFIPWDDDFDFLLFDDTYDKAMDVLQKELPKSMFLEYEKSEPNYFHAWAHVKDLNSECYCEHYPHDEFYKHKGISVDLYRIFSMKESQAAEFRFNAAIDYIEKRKALGFIDEADYQKRKKFYEERLEKEKTDSEKLCLVTPNGYKFGRDPVENFFPLRHYVFENTEFLGPANAHALLSNWYGNYMELPPEKDRVPHYSKVNFL